MGAHGVAARDEGGNTVNSGRAVPRGAGHAFATLMEVGRVLSGATNLRGALNRVLEVLCETGTIRGSIALVNEDDGTIVVQAAEGPVRAGAHTASYGPGEGIPGRVVESGRAVVVPRISQEPSFLFRVTPRAELRERELSHVCAPLLVQGRAVGTLDVDLPFEPGRDYEVTLQFFQVVATMVAQSVALRRRVDSEQRRLADENVHLRQELKERYDFSNIIGTSGPMRQVYQAIEQVARTGTTVILRGESGTGKELVAHAIHYNSPRANGPFVKVSCAALPETLIESELFGYEKGAFTGAHQTKKGRFELAAGGTLFLDEIGELSLATQVKLLRVLQEHEFERLGGTQPIRADVRLITATHRALERAIEEGTFRSDLYYRLNVFPIAIPPLRERKPDIVQLADHFLEKFAREHHKTIKRIATPAIDMLMSYHWPGNVRELINALERAVVVCDGQVIHAHHLPPTLQTAEASGTMTVVSLGDAVEAYEKDLIQDALKSTRGIRAKAARLLHTTDRVLNYKIEKYGIDYQRFMDSPDE